MKRLSSPDSLGALIRIDAPKEERTGKRSELYSKEFQAMLDSLDEEDCIEEASHATEKKRRLTVDQVRALEKNFEVENKLEPERKAKLATELGLQPRQVAIWFQNRRARWKAKQLERDYSLLKASYDALKLDYDNLEKEKMALAATLKELKAKFHEENGDSSQSVKEESPVSDSENNVSEQSKNLELSENVNAQLLISPASSTSFQFNGPASSSHPLMNWIQLSTTTGNSYQPQCIRIEEQQQPQSLFSSEESCNFFSVDQAPNLHWYFSDQ